jgi:hypothetical protein
MITEIDLRINYKAETGYAPTWSFTETTENDLSLWPEMKPTKYCDYTKWVTHEYIEWIESKIPTARKQYFTKYKMHPTYKGTNGKTYFDSNYKKWIEKIYCNILNFLEQIK